VKGLIKIVHISSPLAVSSTQAATSTAVKLPPVWKNGNDFSSGELAQKVKPVQNQSSPSVLIAVAVVAAHSCHDVVWWTLKV